MTRLQPGMPAPSFDAVDLYGAPLRVPPQNGRKLMLSFYRYASCPLCNITVNELARAHPELSARGLDMIAVFQSPADEMRQYVGRQDAPFPLVADPDMALYRKYGVETGWLGLIKAGLQMGKFASALSRGYLPGKISGPMNRLPADFLIDADGTLSLCYYGSDIGDHLPLSEIHAFAAGKRAA